MATFFSQAVQEFKRLPGVGQKSAERIAFHLLEIDRSQSHQLMKSIKKLVEHTVFCITCGLISEHSPCRICSSPKRNHSVICVIKNIQDAIIIERSGGYEGLYHVLGGMLSPLRNIYEQDLSIAPLLKRLNNQEPTKEIIFAFEKSIETEATIQLLKERINTVVKNKNTLFSRMAIGIPSGTSLEYLDAHTLKESLKNRYTT